MSRPRKYHKFVKLTLKEQEFLMVRDILNKVIKGSRRDCFGDRYCDFKKIFSPDKFDLIHSARRKFNKAHEEFNFGDFEDRGVSQKNQ